MTTALILLLAPAAFAAPAPSLSGPGVSTSSAAFASSSAPASAALRPLRLTFLPLVHIYLISEKATTQADNVVGLYRAMRGFAEAAVGARDGTSDDSDPSPHEKFYLKERSYLLQDLATLQHEVESSPAPALWSPGAMRWEMPAPSQTAVASRRPMPSDFSLRAPKKPEHEDSATRLAPGDLEFKP